MTKPDYGFVKGSRPILVSGVYRSGTTFLASILGAHPQLRSSSSTIKFIRFCLGKYGDMTEEKNRRKLVEDSAKRVLVRWDLTLDVEEVLSKAQGASEPSYALMYDLMMRNMLCNGADETVRWVEKLAVQWSGIPDFLDMFPDGRVVHIVRDPRDVTASYKHMTFEKGNTYLDAAFNCRDSMQSVSALSQEYQEKVMLVRAEDLSEEPEDSVKSLCEFLGLDFSGLMLDINSLHASGEEWSSNTSFDGKFEKWPKVKPRWPDKLSRVEVMLIEMLTQPYFSEFNYLSSKYIPTEDEWAEMYQLIDDDFLRGRFSEWITKGRGAEGYRSDPYTHEMKIVFPERYPSIK